jgi:O-antigen/teichoic acid export membrane protein
VTPEVTADKNTEPIPQVPSTAGMTTKVVKGSLWTLAGQVAPLAVSLITTPFVIRMLGAESYGVLILVGLIPAYLGFADFGMGIASTKFASEAYAEGDPVREARIVRTAAFIALCSSLPIALVLLLFSSFVISLLNVPENFHAEASLALKFASVTFVLNFLNSIFNTPQLTRLRMDLNTAVNAGFRILGLIATPIVIYLGGGIVGAIFVLLIASLLTLIGHLFVSSRLDPFVFEFTIDRSIVWPLIKFGSALCASGMAAVFLANSEKVLLPRLASVQTLAHYSVAYTVALAATLFSQAMTQSLVPAFSQLLRPEKREQLVALFSRSVRFNVIALLPVVVTLFVIARPFFTLWAGEEFGRESSKPFYILLIGLFFQVAAYVPGSLLMANGRTDIFAKVYWVELVPYLILIVILTPKFGAVGAALACTIRVIVDTVVFMLLTSRLTGVSFRVFDDRHRSLLLAFSIMAVPMLVTLLTDSNLIVSGILLAVILTIYGLIAWKKLLTVEERGWVRGAIPIRL